MAEKKNRIKGIGKYFRDTGSEIKKIVWPTWRQTWKNALVVLATVAVFAVITWGLDWALTELRTLLFSAFEG